MGAARQHGSKRNPARKQTSFSTEASSDEGAQEGSQEGAHRDTRRSRTPSKPRSAHRSQATTGARIGADWTPSEQTVTKLRVDGVEATAHVPEFVDYWLAVPGAKGLKADWDATFRNWVRRLIADGRASRYVVRPRAVPPAPEDAIDVGEREFVELVPVAARVAP